MLGSRRPRKKRVVRAPMPDTWRGSRITLYGTLPLAEGIFPAHLPPIAAFKATEPFFRIIDCSGSMFSPFLSKTIENSHDQTCIDTAICDLFSHSVRWIKFHAGGTKNDCRELWS